MGSEPTRWDRLVADLTRCEHGRIQGDRCFSCPDGVSPDQSGREVGWSLDGTYRVVVPPRELSHDPDNWYVLREVSP